MRRFALRRGRSISWSPPSRRLPVAFTILELLVVVAIIGLLLGILLPSLRNAREQARIAKCLANVRNLLTATHAYFAESDERFPFIVKTQNSWNGFSSWSHAGKTGDEYWLHRFGGTAYTEAPERALNPYLLNAPVGVDDEVEVLRCPSDVDCYQRVWGRPGAEPEPIAAYDDIGTSYHFNVWALYDVEGEGIPVRRWLHHGRYWMILNRLAVRDVLADFAPRYAFYYEDPVDFAVGNQIRLPGKHGAFSRHVAGFLDGHADYLRLDTDRWCGGVYTFLNLRWVRFGAGPLPAIHYKPQSGKTCE